MFERALKFVPSLRIWETYLDETLERVEKKCILSTRFSKVNDLFERAINSIALLTSSHVKIHRTTYLAIKTTIDL